MKKVLLMISIMIAVTITVSWMSTAVAQTEAAAPAVAETALVPAAGAEESHSGSSGGFLSVVFGSGALGVILWFMLFGAGGAGVYFAVDCGITVRPQRIMPQALIDNVTDAMAEGDVLKALQSCENDPGPLANVLTAGFSHVEEGFDIIQETIGTAADLETEKIVQKITWMSVVGNLAPMLGLLGTVQGMIMAFGHISEGAMDVNVLAKDISQALFTTAGGLTIAVPCVAGYYTFRNLATRIVLRMEAMTMELIKDLRNVEVVEE